MSGAAAPSADDADSRWLKIPDAADGEAVPVTVLVIGGGSRGRGYGFFALDFPKRMKTEIIRRHLSYRLLAKPGYGTSMFHNIFAIHRPSPPHFCITQRSLRLPG